MRDYRTLSAEDFVGEGIEMKMRWLARRLRFLDKAEEIGQWVLSVTSLNDLLQKIRPQWRGSVRTIQFKYTETKILPEAHNPCPLMINFEPQSSINETDVAEGREKEARTTEKQSEIQMEEKRELLEDDPTDDIEKKTKLSTIWTRRRRTIMRGRRTVVQKEENRWSLPLGGSGDVRELDAERQRRRKKKLKELWRQAIWRKLEEEGKQMRNWQDKDGF